MSPAGHNKRNFMRNNINIRKMFRPVVLTLTAIAVVIPTACCRHEVPAENAILMSARQDETTRAVINEKTILADRAYPMAPVSAFTATKLQTTMW
jgi:hypothetical protein